MSIYKVPHPDDLMECPYNKFHMIRAKRFPYHLLKCRKSFMDLDYATCPFNARHEMPRPELRYHVANCPDKALIYRDLIYSQARNDEDTFKGYTGVPKYNRDWDDLEGGETWDDDQQKEAVMFYGKKKALRSVVTMTKWGSVEHGSASETQLRLPRETPQVLKAALSEKGALPPKPTTRSNNQLPSSVFNYSAMKTMPGIGRGRAVAKQPPASPSVGKSRSSGEKKIAANIYGDQNQKVATSSSGDSTRDKLTDTLTALSRGRGMAMKINKHDKAPAVGGVASNMQSSDITSSLQQKASSASLQHVQQKAASASLQQKAASAKQNSACDEADGPTAVDEGTLGPADGAGGASSGAPYVDHVSDEPGAQGGPNQHFPDDRQVNRRALMEAGLKDLIKQGKK